MTTGRAIAFAWEAGIFCYDCTVEEWGEPDDPVSPWADDVGAVFPGDEFDYYIYCEGCGVDIDGIQVLAY